MEKRKGFDLGKFFMIFTVIIWAGVVLISIFLLRPVFNEKPSTEENQKTDKATAFQSSNNSVPTEHLNEPSKKQNEKTHINKAIGGLESLDSRKSKSLTELDGVDIDFDNEEPKDFKQEVTVESNPTLEQQRQELADTAMAEIPLLVDQWNEVMARRHELSDIPNSEARAQEFNRLTNERTRIEHRIIFLAMAYQAIHPEGGAIYYPEGKIGQLAKEVGLVFGRTSK